MSPLLTAAGRLAQVADEDVTPGLLGFLVVIALVLATWVLMRSMGRQLRRINLPPAAAPVAGEPQPGDGGEAEPGEDPDSRQRGP